ncbi:dockerin type I repeat-containing protein, partial [Ruminococcus flavefaciens]|uniref:dockerin type I repeat-containing protein n=1 Tax=Ruminococcus flavefaciens TaxID=1265 RepID=UPI0025EF6264
CLKAGTTTLTAKSSDGQRFEVEIIVKTVEVDPIASKAIKGDANCDGHVDMADAVLIMQALANPDRFGENGTNENHITEQGMKNADISGDNDGVTAGDALAIQRKLLGLDD